MQQIFSDEICLKANGIILKPLSLQHEEGLKHACQDGELWNIRVTSVPHVSQVNAYIETALQQKQQQCRVPFVVLRESDGTVLGTTSFHDIILSVRRLEIGYTWYAQSVQRTHVNTTCKLLLLAYAFEQLNAETVGLRTDIFNLKSQKAIERLGIKKDGVLRGYALRRDGTIRDTVMYSSVKGEWLNIQAHLNDLMRQYHKTP